MLHTPEKAVSQRGVRLRPERGRGTAERGCMEGSPWELRGAEQVPLLGRGSCLTGAASQVF